MGEMCRLCLSEKDVLIPIFYRGSDLPDHIKACLAVQVSSEEPHKHICITCDGKLRYWWTFKLEIQSAQKFLNNQYSKSLYSRTVTSSEENQSPSKDPNKSSNLSFDSPFSQSPIKVKNCHSLALTSGHEFEDSLGFGASTGPTAVIIKQEPLCNSARDGRGPVQVVPVSAAVETNAYYQSSHLDVSSSSGGNAFNRESAASSKTAGRRNSLRSKVQAEESDDCLIIEPPPKRKCPLVTLDDASQKKRQKTNSDASKKTQNNKIPPTERKKPGPKPSPKSSPQPSDSNGSSLESGGSEEAGPKKCKHCPSVFSSKHELTVHMKYHTLLGNIGRQNIQCPYCSNSMQVYSLPGHVKNVHKMDPDAAGIPNYIEITMGSRVKTQNQPSVKAVNGMKIVVFSCNLCKNSYKTLFALKMHKKRSHSNVANSNPLKQAKAKSWNCTCPRCKRQLISRAGLAFHQQYCGTDRSSVCPFCSQEFETVVRLKRHIGDKHSGNDPVPEQAPTADLVNSTNSESTEESQALLPSSNLSYSAEWKRRNGPKCLKCGRRFMLKEKLLIHEKYCGTDKSFKCFFCPEQYNSSGSMNNHSRRIHNKTVFPCDFCNQKFSTKAEQEDHRKIHKQLLKTKLYHKCRGCQNVYHGLASFNGHKLDCKKNFALKCEKCFMHFKEQNSLDVHTSRCTGKAQLEEKLKLALKAVKCLQCTNRFSGENEFINHYVQSHVNAANSIFSGVNSCDCHFCFFAANNPTSVKNHLPHCRGISFYVVKSAAKKQAAANKSTNVQASGETTNQRPSTETKISRPSKSSTPSTSRQSNTNVEITKICSPSFMNEHLSASKSAQVVVEKLSDTLIHNVSNLKKENSVFIKSEPTKPNRTPTSKVKCPYCSRWFTPAGLPSHKCHKKKKIQARMKNQEKRSKKQVKPRATPSTNTYLIKCELCYDMVQQEALPEHLKVIHQAVKPAEMARSMIELSMMKQALNTHLVKEEVVDRNDTEDVGHSDDEMDSQNELPCDENETVEADATEEFDEEMNEMVEEVETNEDADEEDDTDHRKESTSNSVEPQEELAQIPCDICQSAFTMPDLEVHLKNVHNAVNPAAMARTMMENSVTFPRITLHDASDDLLEESVKTRCDICKLFFTLPDLKTHLKKVHHAVNPDAMAQTMMENNLSFSRITVNVKPEYGPASEDEENSSPADSQDSAGKSMPEEGEEEANFEEGSQNLDTLAEETNVLEGQTDPLSQFCDETSTNVETNAVS